jgi:sugar transferase (PEP-CTERM/EpsH1 system associated)
MNAGGDPAPLVVHVLHRFDTGGLENGVVNLINRMPALAGRVRFRHAVVALTDVTSFAARLEDRTVPCIALHKPPGQGVKLWPRLIGLLREWRPAIVHTRNLAALEMQPAAWWSGVPVRIHGEHGRDADDTDGQNRRLQFVRRLYAPFVQRFVVLSKETEGYLRGRVGIAGSRIEHIYNGVDTAGFGNVRAIARPVDLPFDSDRHFVVGSVGRFAEVKNPLLLVRAFARACTLDAEESRRMRLVMLGDGPLRGSCLAELGAAGLSDRAWLPGDRADVADVMAHMSCFVQPSLTEGISNTILEAMASGLPVLATDVGGNGELVVAGETGVLLPSGGVRELAEALVERCRDAQGSIAMGAAGRARVQSNFSLHRMVAAYQSLYERLWQSEID